MLRSLRQGGFIKGLMGAVVVLIILAFAMDYRGGGVSVTGGDDCAAEVDGRCVPMKDYNMLLRLVAPAGASDKELRKAGYVDHAIEALVERELLLAEAKRLGVAVSEEDLDAELALGRVHYSWPVEAPLPNALAQGMPYPLTGAAELVTYLRVRNSKTDAFDYEIYRRQIQNLLRMSPREFKERQANEVIAARVRAMVTAAVRVSEDEAFSFYEREKSQATVRSVSVPTAWFERFAVVLGDAEVKAFDAANTAQVDTAWAADKAAWKGDCPLYAKLSFGVDKDGSEEERAEQKAEAEQVRGWLANGLSFERAAQLFGAAAGSSDGAVGCLEGEGPDAAAFGTALAPLRAGELSPVLETETGFHVLKALGKLPAAEAESLGRLSTARSVATQQTAKTLAKQFASDVLAKAKAGTELSAALDAQLMTAVNVSGLPGDMAETVRLRAKQAPNVPEFDVSREFSRSGSPLPGLKSRDAARRVFDLPEPGAVLDEVLETYAGFAVLQLKEKTLATREAFDKDKLDLLEELKDRKRSDALSSYLDRLRAATKTIVINPSLTNPPAAEGSAAPNSDATNSG